MFRPLIVAAAIVTTTAQIVQVCPEVPLGACEICGPGLCVQNPTALSDHFGIECGKIEQEALGGFLNDFCPEAQAATGPCGCGISSTLPISPPVLCPTLPVGACEICGPGRCVQNPFASVDVFGDSCAEIEQSASTDSLALPFIPCAFFQSTTGPCACGTLGGVTPAPVAPSTPAPVAIEPSPTLCPEVPLGSCEICGPSRCVQNPTATLSTFDIDCGTAEQAMLQALDFGGFCEDVQGSAGSCGCGGGPGLLCPEVLEGSCEICGPGLCVQSPVGKLDDFGISCVEAQQDAISGDIPPFLCADFQAARGPCDCGTIDTPAPVAPSDAPVLPTDAPVTPTDAPLLPTDAHVMPTDAPVALTPPSIYIEGQNGPSTFQFFLVIAAPTNRVLEPSLFDTATIDLALFGTALNIKFEPSNANVVRENFSRDSVLVRSEGVAPYAIAGDNPPGNYFSWTPENGRRYEIEVEGLDSGGAVVETRSIMISFCSGCSGNHMDL